MSRIYIYTYRMKKQIKNAAFIKILLKLWNIFTPRSVRNDHNIKLIALLNLPHLYTVKSNWNFYYCVTNENDYFHFYRVSNPEPINIFARVFLQHHKRKCYETRNDEWPRNNIWTVDIPDRVTLGKFIPFVG